MSDELREIPPALQNLPVGGTQALAKNSLTDGMDDFDTQSIISKFSGSDIEETTTEVTPTPETTETTEATEQTPTEVQTDEPVVEEDGKKGLSVKDPLSLEEATPAEVTPEEEEVEPEFPKEHRKQKEAFAKMSHSEREWKRKAKSLEVETEELRKKASGQIDLEKIPEYQQLKTLTDAQQEELNRLKQEYQKARQTLEVVRVEESDEYQSSVRQPWEKQILPTLASIAAGSEGQVTLEQLHQIAQVADPFQQRQALREIKDKIDPSDYHEYAGMLPKYRDVVTKNKELRENAEKINALRQKQGQDQFEQQRGDYLKKFGEAKKATREKIRKAYFSADESDPDVQAAIKGNESKVESAFQDWYQVPLETQANTIAALEALPIANAILERKLVTVTAQLKKLEAENKELKSTTSKLAKASPDAGGGGQQRQVESGEEVIDLSKHKGSLNAADLAKLI